MLIPSQTHPKVRAPNKAVSFSPETEPRSDQHTSTESVCGHGSQLRPAGCKQPGPHKGVKLCLGDQAHGQAWPSSSRLQPPWSEPAPPRHLAPTPCGLSHKNSKCMSKGPCPRQVGPGKMGVCQVHGRLWQKRRGRTGRARRSPGQKASSSSAVEEPGTWPAGARG